jgi:hypothetical protein
MSDTHVTITGNLTADPELRFTNNGGAVANFRIAVTSRVRDATPGGVVRGAELLYRAHLPDLDQDQAAVDEVRPTASPAGKRERVRQAYAAMVAAGEPVTGTRLAQAAGVSASYGRALLAEFHGDPAAAQPNAGPSLAGPSHDRDGDDLADLPGLRRRLRAA